MGTRNMGTRNELLAAVFFAGLGVCGVACSAAPGTVGAADLEPSAPADGHASLSSGGAAGLPREAQINALGGGGVTPSNLCPQTSCENVAFPALSGQSADCVASLVGALGWTLNPDGVTYNTNGNNSVACCQPTVIGKTIGTSDTDTWYYFGANSGASYAPSVAQALQSESCLSAPISAVVIPNTPLVSSTPANEDGTPTTDDIVWDLDPCTGPSCSGGGRGSQ